MIPKYFNDLHLAICAITGEPRIASFKDGQKSTEKYKNIPMKEWKAAILNWFSLFKENKSFVQVLKDYTFCIGGKAKDKQTLIQGLRNLADILEKQIHE